MSTLCTTCAPLPVVATKPSDKSSKKKRAAAEVTGTLVSEGSFAKLPSHPRSWLALGPASDVSRSQYLEVTQPLKEATRPGTTNLSYTLCVQVAVTQLPVDARAKPAELLRLNQHRDGCVSVDSEGCVYVLGRKSEYKLTPNTWGRLALGWNAELSYG